MKRTLCGIQCLFIVAGCGGNDAPESLGPETSTIETVREGGIPKFADLVEAESWMKENLTKGETSKDDVLTLFGTPGRSEKLIPGDLDRPERDGVDTFQYQLWYHDSVNWAFLVLHCDTTADVLIDWEISRSLCGFCPHVFADADRRWRLEGKMLAGCVGKENEGSDTLLLPRLGAGEDSSLRVKLSNLAPETDHVSRFMLAAVPLNERQELDISADGDLVVWNPLKEEPIDFDSNPGSLSRVVVTIDPGSESDVIVLEVRNTAAFETEMRRIFLESAMESRNSALLVDFGHGQSAEIPPVGTKFLRRIVVPIPPGTNRVTLTTKGDFWYTRRLWLGSRIDRDREIHWESPLDPRALRLSPMDEAELVFPARPLEGSSSSRMAYALRIDGWYEFEAIR